jgi:disulfide bond formation protein DsbB
VDQAFVTTLFACLAVGADAAVAGFTVLAIGARRARALRRARDAVWDRAAEVALPLAAAVALTATLGSLYYSEVVGFVPCELCWYQRIAMYPLPILLAVAWRAGDLGIRRYVLPIAVVGGAISLYHYQLEWFPQQATLACSAEVPCTVVWFRVFGYLSLPSMALSGFALIGWLSWIAGQRAPDGVGPGGGAGGRVGAST